MLQPVIGRLRASINRVQLQPVATPPGAPPQLTPTAQPQQAPAQGARQWTVQAKGPLVRNVWQPNAAVAPAGGPGGIAPQAVPQAPAYNALRTSLASQEAARLEADRRQLQDEADQQWWGQHQALSQQLAAEQEQERQRKHAEYLQGFQVAPLWERSQYTPDDEDLEYTQ